MRKYLLLIVLLSCLLPLPAQAQENSFPQRIVSLGPINTENIYLLGAEDRLVGNTSYCVRPDAARSKEKIGSVMQVSIEKILSLKPDLILATGLTQPQQADKLRELGLRTEQFQQPASFAEICAQFRRIGELLARYPKADQVCWAQEEPANMGAWTFVEPNIEWVLTRIGARHTRPTYAGRAAAASPATGLASQHKAQQEALVNDALTLEGN